MNKEEIIISFENQNGLRIAPDSDITTGKVVVNGIEITSVEDWEKVTKSLIELQKENEKLNHYKLLYQKVKERNTEAIEYLEQQLEYSKKDCIPARQFTCEKSLKILEGNNEVSDD